MSSTLRDQLFDEILQARQRVYAVGSATPLQELVLPGIGVTVFAKREDLGPIKAYKWRGAYNCMAKLTPEQRAGGVVAASAGNHGVDTLKTGGVGLVLYAALPGGCGV